MKSKRLTYSINHCCDWASCFCQLYAHNGRIWWISLSSITRSVTIIFLFFLVLKNSLRGRHFTSVLQRLLRGVIILLDVCEWQHWMRKCIDNLDEYVEKCANPAVMLPPREVKKISSISISVEIEFSKCILFFAMVQPELSLGRAFEWLLMNQFRCYVGFFPYFLNMGCV